VIFFLEGMNMAVKGQTYPVRRFAGTEPLANNPDPPMVEQTHFDARSGAPKKALASFDTKWGMRDMNAPSGVTSAIGPVHPGVGPDASAADVLDPESPAQRGKALKRQPGALIPGEGGNGATFMPGTLKPSWGLKGGMGQTVDNNIGGQVLGEAILSGSTKLPAATSENSGPGVAYTGRDPN
jgi:hypothetical protein